MVYNYFLEMDIQTDLVNADSTQADSAYLKIIADREQKIKNLLEMEKNEDSLLYDILCILENKWLWWLDPTHLINYDGNSISISFSYWNPDISENNYKALIEFLWKEDSIEKIDFWKKENGFANVKTKSWKGLSIYYKEWKNFIYIDWIFTNNAINLWKKICPWLKIFINKSISKQQEKKKIEKEKPHKRMWEDDDR